MNIHNLQIIGFGPAALGLFVAADRGYRLSEFLDSGIQIHERAPSLHHWRSLKYYIPSNSPAGEFLTGIRKDGIFSDILESDAGKYLSNNAYRTVCLSKVSDFLKLLMYRVKHIIDEHPSCHLHWSSYVSTLQVDDVFMCNAPNGKSIVSRHLVVSTGSKQRQLEQSSISKFPTYSSEALQRGILDEDIIEYLQNGYTPIVVGGSHSGFSTAGFILDRFGKYFSETNPFYLYSRSPIKQMLTRREAQHIAINDNDRIDPETGDINKFSGVRHNARELYRKVMQGHEKRLVIKIADNINPHNVLRPIIISAIGYRPTPPRIIDSENKVISIDLLPSGSSVTKDPITQELQHQGNKISNAFGMGLGYSDIGSDGEQVGVNFFHGDTASKLVTHLLKRITVETTKDKTLQSARSLAREV